MGGVCDVVSVSPVGSVRYVGTLPTLRGVDRYPRSLTDLHVLQVVPASILLGEKANLSEEDKLLLKTAALYHDVGYIEQYEKNEPIGTREM